MGQLVYILGRSGTGKSYSIRNFPKDKVAVINVQGKVLPFKGASAIEQTPTDNSANILKALDIYAHDYKSIVIDDYQYVMSNEFMRRSSERGYDKFTEIARHAWDIANHVRNMPDDVIVYIMCHTDRDDEGNEKIKTIGRLLDEKICLEGLSTIVLKTNVSDGQYTFLTQNNGKDTVKSPYGMFPTYAIDNDLYYVDQKIRNYYEMGEYKNDEEIAQMDQTVAKEDVQKPDSKGRTRRNRKSADKGSDGSGNESDSQTESRSAEVVSRDDGAGTESVSDKPKKRTRKAIEVKAEEVSTETEQASEQAENAPQDIKDSVNGFAEPEHFEEVPKRRRRRKANTLTEEDMTTDHTLDIKDDDLPF